MAGSVVEIVAVASEESLCVSKLIFLGSKLRRTMQNSFTMCWLR